MSESSDTRFLNVCRRHLDIYRNDPKWNSSNPLLEITNLETRLNQAYTIAAGVPAKLAPQKILINKRQETYAKFKPFVRKSRRYLKSSGASEREIADAATYINKVLGNRTVPKPKENPDAPAAESLKTHSVSQQTYDSQYGNLVAYRAFIGNVESYVPNEEEVNLTTLDNLIEEADDSNAAISAGFVPLSDAWNLRDAKLYDDEDSVLELFRDAKEYYKSLYDPKTPQYRTITARDMSVKPRGRS